MRDAAVRDWTRDDQRWAAWMSAAQDGVEKAYEQLLTEVAAAIEQYLRARFGPVDFVDDILQECLLSLHKGRHTYDKRRPFRAWLFAIVRHRSVDCLRRRGKDTGGAPSAEADVPTQAAAVATIIDASLILSQLTEEHRTIIVLTKYFGYSAQEVSEQLGISVAAVRVRLHRALRHTRRLIDTEELDLQ
jgi:RNA polymerase sigma-70 factor (ECF subfamily)